jgi:(p)ppGpp synthase/HD superfamily hydrolase
MVLSPRFEQALLYTCMIHSGQVRKASSIPYVAHLLSVAGLALEYGADEDEAIAALLHDAVEDAGGKARAADIRQRFGERVAEIVAGCTDADTAPKPPWQERKRTYIDGLEKAGASVRFVSCCDKLHNARSIVKDLRQHGERVWHKFQGGRDGSLWYYTTLCEAYRRLGVCPPLVEELDRTLRDMQQLAQTAPPSDQQGGTNAAAR